MPNQLTATVKADIHYRSYQEENIYSLEDRGNIEYELEYSGGVSGGEVNQIWYANKTHSIAGIVSLNLESLDFERLTYDFDIDFVGPANGKIKAMQVINRSPNALHVRIPTFDFYMVPPSGQVEFSTLSGWAIDTGQNVDISGNGTVQPYSIVLIGSIQ